MKKSMLTLTFLLVMLVLFNFYGPQFVDENDNSNEPELIRFDPLETVQPHGFQTMTDQVATAAMDDNWNLAAYHVQQLITAWQAVKPHTEKNLELTGSIDRLTAKLEYHVGQKDQTAVLETVSELTLWYAALYQDGQQRE